jgi:hypothetical protein
MLKFSGIQPVQFGAKDCTPATIDTETRLRLDRLRFDTEADTKKAEETLAGCFPDDEAYVLEFIRTKMTETDKRYLQAYLTGGERAITALDESIKTAIADKIAKATEA